MTRAAIYCRISQDELGLGRGVERQLEDAHALASARGWEVAGVFTDNDTSAFSGATRDAYERLIAEAKSGAFQHIIVWQTSRLWRTRTERARSIGDFGKLRIGIAAVKGPDLDLTTASGRMLAGILGEFDTMESEVKSERIARESLQRAERGVANGRVAYGWRRERQLDDHDRVVGFRDVEHPEQAQVVRELCRRVVAHETLSSIWRDLNARGVASASGRPWMSNMIRAIVLRPANVGLRMYHGKVLGPAEWPAIVPQDLYDRAVAILQAPERRQTRDGRRRWLLSHGGGIGFCGVCSGHLSVKTERHGAAPYYSYHCASRTCVSRVMTKVDALVRDAVIQRLSQPDARELFDGDDAMAEEARERADAIRARLNVAADAFAAGTINGEQLKRISATLQPQLEQAQADQRRARRPALPDEVDDLLGDKASEVWERMPVAAQRSILQAMGLQVRILPQKRGPGFDPSKVEFRFV